MERDVGDLSPNDQIECMKNALGERRGHIKGVGHVMRKPTPEVSSGRQLTPRDYWQQLEKIASTFKRKEQVINRQFRLLPGNRGDSGGRRDYRGDSSGSRDGSGDDEDDG
ncbi:hypothetical protein HanPI659440_Chr11g0403701 [Helianthus annuus]|nr:hypothetical protein HanPI659440_Chr11g0403701 [Helianthus annuus]